MIADCRLPIVDCRLSIADYLIAKSFGKKIVIVGVK